MSTQHIATAAVVKVSIGSVTGNRVAQLITRGDLVPDGVAEEQLEHLVSRGLIEAVEAGEPEEPEEPAELDEGAYKRVSVADLKSEIENRNDGREDDAKIVPAEPGQRPQLVAALLADDNK
ncbi:hypothetical protein [Microbacterium galbinum]|uniref:Uncharacterized protein n=1 Tax=Microbacterium galbinum TaxID=2851646 RepID=A0ABY4IP02_9MICO|nr:hypothetical protein [Microbacterium galbinum]UPL13018.1 hypothetical protein KV396_00275 [Microbacterium galbinum]